jgi:hypothetical protein
MLFPETLARILQQPSLAEWNFTFFEGGFFMDTLLKNAAATYMVPRVARGFKMSWLVYGAAAYFGIRYLNKRGILPAQTGAALNFVDQGINMVKRQVGLDKNPYTPHGPH